MHNTLGYLSRMEHQNETHSLVYIQLGNEFVSDSKNDVHDSVKLLAYINFLIKNVEVMKLELGVHEDIFGEHPDNIDVTCLCYINNEIGSNNSAIPDRYMIGAIDYFTYAGQHVSLIDEAAARKSYINEYLTHRLNIYELAPDFLEKKLVSSDFFDEDWNEETLIEEANRNLGHLAEIPQTRLATNLGFYSWLYMEIKQNGIANRFVRDFDLERTKVKGSEKGIWYRPEPVNPEI